MSTRLIAGQEAWGHPGCILTLIILWIALLSAACTPQSAESIPDPPTTAAPGASPRPVLQSTGQNLSFERISIQQGLSHSTVNCIFQDSLGFMWFGTRDGLNRYDGYSFSVYKHNPDDPHSLSHNQVMSIFEDSTGKLWVGTYGGGINRLDRSTGQFTRYDTEDFQNITDEPEEYRNAVLRIAEVPTGVLWIATHGGGLVSYDLETESFTSYAPDPLDRDFWGHEWITALLVDNSGILWLGTSSEGLDRFDPATGQMTTYRNNPVDPDSLGHNWISDIIQDHSGAIWIGTNGGGLDRFDPETERFTHYRHDPSVPHSLNSDYIWSIVEDPGGILWVGTSDGGLDAFDPGSETYTHFHHDVIDPTSLSSDRIRSLFLSPSGILWVGTQGGGVNKSDPASGRFKHYRGDPEDAQRLSDYHVASLLEGQDSTLWIGTSGGGLDALDRETGQWQHYRQDPSDPYSSARDYVLAIQEDKAGNLWLGTGWGFFRFNPQTGSFDPYPHNPPDPGDVKMETINAIYEDQSGTLWLGTSGKGLSEFDPTTGIFTYYQHGWDPTTGLPEQHPLSSNFVNDVVEDGSGVLWIGTSQGLNRFDRESDQWSFFLHDTDDPHSLSSNQIPCVYVDRSGTLWVGTQAGLNRYNSEAGTFTQYREQDGLVNDSVFDILEDDQGFLWITTANGLSRFDPGSETFKSYTAADGLPINEFGAAYKSGSGEMFVGGINGFISFFPDQMTNNANIPPVVLTSLRQNGVEMKTGLAPEDLTSVTFHWPDNAFEFEFAALNYIQPEKNQHAYMLEGFDRDWNDIGSQRFGRYTNLPAGTYALRLKGSNNDGVWNEDGLSIRVTVVPPFWSTWWFRGIAALVVLAGVVVGYRLRIRNLESRSRDLEKQVQTRTAELQAEIAQRYKVEEILRQHEREQAVTEERNRLARELHDSVTQSLYGVTLYADAATRLLERGEAGTAANNLQKLRRTARGALGEMRLLIFELRPPILEKGGLLAGLASRLEAVEGRSGLKTQLVLNGEGDLPPDVQEGLYRIALEALNNVLKHAEASCVTISLDLEPDNIVLKIVDDGVGFELDAAQASGGLGLSGMGERAEQLGGRLILESKPGMGTTVKVQLKGDQ